MAQIAESLPSSLDPMAASAEEDMPKAKLPEEVVLFEGGDDQISESHPDRARIHSLMVSFLKPKSLHQAVEVAELHRCPQELCIHDMFEALQLIQANSLKPDN